MVNNESTYRVVGESYLIAESVISRQQNAIHIDARRRGIHTSLGGQRWKTIKRVCRIVNITWNGSSIQVFFSRIKEWH